MAKKKNEEAPEGEVNSTVEETAKVEETEVSETEKVMADDAAHSKADQIAKIVLDTCIDNGLMTGEKWDQTDAATREAITADVKAHIDGGTPTCTGAILDTLIKAVNEWAK